jgi:hypothetical protein
VPLRVLCNRLGDYLLFPAVYRFAVSSSENTERTESPRRDLNARPKVYETFIIIIIIITIDHFLHFRHRTPQQCMMQLQQGADTWCDLAVYHQVKCGSALALIEYYQDWVGALSLAGAYLN